MSVRLTCLKILEQLFTANDQSQFESDEEFKNRKNRYFRLIMDRFNDKESQVRGAVLSFISNNIQAFQQDNQVKISLIKELVLRVLKDTQEFQTSSLEILVKIIFPTYSGKSDAKKAVNIFSKQVIFLISTKMKKGTRESQKKTKDLVDREEERVIEIVIDVQKDYEIGTDIMVRVFRHFQENQADSVVFLNRLLQVSLRLLDEQIKDKEQRRHLLGILEVLSKLKIGQEIYQDLAIFLKYFDKLIIERASIPLSEKETRAELNLCILIILDTITNIFQTNSLIPCPSLRSILAKMDEKIIELIPREGNTYVLKKLIELSAYSVNYCSCNIERVLHLFNQRYVFLQSARNDMHLSTRVSKEAQQQESEMLAFKISSSIYIVSIYTYNFVDGAFKALTFQLKDLVALLLFFLSLKNEKIQSASFENLSLLWEKDYDLIFTCQHILSELLQNQSTSPKLLITIYSIFDKYILKHTQLISKKFQKLTKIKNIMQPEGEEVERDSTSSEFEHISSVISELVLKSYESLLNKGDQELKQHVLRLITVLLRESLLLFQQVGVNLIPLVCDTDSLTRTLVNGILSEQCLRNKFALESSFKRSLKKTPAFIDSHYGQFTVTQDNQHNPISFFDRLNSILKLTDNEGNSSVQHPEKDQSTLIFVKLAEIIEDIHEFTFEDHEVAFFSIMVLVSLNHITVQDLICILTSLQRVAQRLYFEVSDFLKSSEENGDNNSTEDDNDSIIEHQFIKSNVLLMVLVTAHVLASQTHLTSGNPQQLDACVAGLLEGQQSKARWIKKFNGDSTLLNNITYLFLEQMREFDCSDISQLRSLRAKIKLLFYEYIQPDTIKITDLSYLDNISSNIPSCTKVSSVRTQTTKNKMTKQQNQNSRSQTSHHSCKNSKKSHMSDIEFSTLSAHSLPNHFKMTLRTRKNNNPKRMSLKNKICESDSEENSFSDEQSD